MVALILPAALHRLISKSTSLNFPVHTWPELQAALTHAYPNLAAQIFPAGVLHPHFSLYLNGQLLKNPIATEFKTHDELEFLVAVAGG